MMFLTLRDILLIPIFVVGTLLVMASFAIIGGAALAYLMVDDFSRGWREKMKHGFCETCKHRDGTRCDLLRVKVKPGDWCRKHEIKGENDVAERDTNH